MFGTQPEPDSQGTDRVARANPFVTLIVFALGLVALLVALRMATQQRPVNIPSQQVVTHAKR
jgi:hypothetical protein